MLVSPLVLSLTVRMEAKRQLTFTELRDVLSEETEILVTNSAENLKYNFIRSVHRFL
jgi:hypothetical protein